MFQDLIEQSSDALYVADGTTGEILYVNDQACQDLGYTRDELLGMNVSDIDPNIPDDEAPQQEFIRALERKRQVRFESEHRRRDGSTFPVELSIKAVTRQGRRFGVVVARDITERRRAEETLRQSEERFRQVFESANVGMCLVSPEGYFLEANAALIEMLGYSEEELRTKTFNDVTLPMDHHISVDFQHRALAGQTSQAQFEKRYLSKSGRVVWAQVSSSMLRDVRGEPLYFVAHIVDITERRRAEEALRESEERYRRLFNAGTDAIYVHELTGEGVPGRFVEVNEVACRRLGYTREELLTMSPGDIDAPDKRAVSQAVGRRLLEENNVVFEMENVAKDGTRIPVEISANLFRHNGRNMVLSVARDLSERRHLEAQFLQAQKMEAIGRLAGGVAHDFNNLLTVITGVSEISMNQLSQTHPLYKDLEQIREAGNRAAALTRQLLAFSRRQIIEPKPLDLNAVLAELEKILRRLIGEDIDLVVEPATTLGTVLADAGQIEQLLINLAVNSRDAMPEGGELTISTTNVHLDETFVRDHRDVSAGPYVMLTVSDTGWGMSDEAKVHVFEPFYTTKAEGQGTGLGLATVYGIVKQAGGAIDFTSEPDQGTSFRIYLPLREPEQEHKAIETEDRAMPRGSETILVVEDEPAVRHLACRLLEHLGYKVLESIDVKDALKTVAHYDGPIHLLLTDVIMPEMSGREVANRISLHRPNIKILFMSGYPDETIAQHGVLAKGINLLSKPFTSQEMAVGVRSVLDGRRPAS